MMWFSELTSCMHLCHTHTHTHTLSHHCIECLEELGLLIQNNGMLVCGSQPKKTVPLIAAQITDRDNAVRSAALNAMVTVYGNTGEDVFKFTTQVGGLYSPTLLHPSFHHL